jgi:imidazolonepropionase-like amidohydrolase
LSVELTNCNVLDVRSGEVFGNSTIVIEANAIKGIKEGGTGRTRGKSVDLRGAFVLPGLFNMHNHFAIVFPFKDTNQNESPGITALRGHKRAQDALFAGVTSVRCVGEINRIDLDMKRMIDADWVRGPRITAGGRPLGVTGGHGSGLSQIDCDGADEFRKAARTELSLGANHLKIFISGGIAQKEESFGEPQMTRDEMDAVVSVARSKGTYVVAHSSGSEQIISALEAGVRCFEHAYVLNREAARLMKKLDAYLDPTLTVTRSPGWMREHGFEEWTVQKAVAAGTTHLESIRTAIEEGVTIICGTDMPPGEMNGGVRTITREIEFLCEAGLSNLDAIRAATLHAAQLCGTSDKAGLVAPGYYADLIAVPTNPLKDIKSLREIKLVMKDGEIVRNELAETKV